MFTVMKRFPEIPFDTAFHLCECGTPVSVIVDISRRRSGFAGFVVVSLGCQFVMKFAVEIGRPGLDAWHSATLGVGCRY
jgi:hypothetical protein